MKLFEVEQEFVNAYRCFQNGNPERIHEDPIDPEFLKLVHTLHACASKVERYQVNKKLVTHIGKEFRRSWKHYCNNWRIHVDRACHTMIRGKINFTMPPLHEYRKLINQEPDVIDIRSLPFSFDPAIHAGGSAISLFREAVAVVLEEKELPDDYWEGDDEETEDQIVLTNALSVGLEALDYFEKYIGIDIGKAFDRWHRLPTIVIPDDLSVREDDDTKNSLYELLRDAVRAYLAGATAASVAMCRAALEMVLREYYLHDEKFGREEQKLDTLITIATARYDNLKSQRQKMFALKNRANMTLHRYSYGDSGELDRYVIGFFSDLKHWIDAAPTPTRAQ